MRWGESIDALADEKHQGLPASSRATKVDFMYQKAEMFDQQVTAPQ